MKSLTLKALVGASLASALLVGGTTQVAAETLVTCGPNGAAYIVTIVPAGCRLLAATSAPKHSPVNTVEEARLGFTFNAAKPTEAKNQSVIAKTQAPTQDAVSVALW